MSKLVIIDWGTSNFRAILLDEKLDRVDSITSNDGMLSLKKNEFHPFLLNILKTWLSENKDLTILMSGMVGSMNGWLETKYMLCDVSLNEIANNLVQVPNIDEHIYIVPGVKIDKNNMVDLMRGEEVQIFGALKQINKQEGLFVLPGTHSKWANVKNEKIIDFKTNMTGEIFNVVSSHTILAKSINEKKLDEDSFDKGLELSKREGGLLNQLFQARAQAGNIGENSVFSFLSGIIIGNEIKEMSKLFQSNEVTIVGTSALNDLYEKALSKYSIQTKVLDSDTATIEAMLYIYKQINT